MQTEETGTGNNEKPTRMKLRQTLTLPSPFQKGLNKKNPTEEEDAGLAEATTNDEGGAREEIMCRTKWIRWAYRQRWSQGLGGLRHLHTGPELEILEPKADLSS